MHIIRYITDVRFTRNQTNQHDVREDRLSIFFVIQCATVTSSHLTQIPQTGPIAQQKLEMGSVMMLMDHQGSFTPLCQG